MAQKHLRPKTITNLRSLLQLWTFIGNEEEHLDFSTQKEG